MQREQDGLHIHALARTWLLFLAVRTSRRDSTLRRHVLDPKQPAPQRSSCHGRLVVSQQRKGLKRAKSQDGGLRIKKNVLDNSLDVSPEVKTCSFGAAEFNGGNTNCPKRGKSPDGGLSIPHQVR